jgi:hypothetical protein
MLLVERFGVGTLLSTYYFDFLVRQSLETSEPLASHARVCACAELPRRCVFEQMYHNELVQICSVHGAFLHLYFYLFICLFMRAT